MVARKFEDVVVGAELLTPARGRIRYARTRQALAEVLASLDTGGRTIVVTESGAGDTRQAVMSPSAEFDRKLIPQLLFAANKEVFKPTPKLVDLFETIGIPGYFANKHGVNIHFRYYPPHTPSGRGIFVTAKPVDLGRLSADSFDLNELRAKHVAEVMTQNLDLEQGKQTLKRDATIDTLTELPNRRAATEHFMQLHDIARRNHYTRGQENNHVMFVMGDVDRFKSVNDTYGHEAGDVVLQEVGRRLRRSLLRPMDMLARWGGEEFVGIGLVNGIEDARKVAERMRQTVAAEPIGLPDGKSLNVTISLGLVAERPFTDFNNGVIKTLAALADQGLYVAKGSGRNIVIAMDSNCKVVMPRKAEVPVSKRAKQKTDTEPK